MGLDMYLNARKHIANWDFRPEEQVLNKQVREVLGLGHLEDSDSMVVSITVGYWRKANAVHKWFVDNCQGGEDDCRHAWVGRDQLKMLLDLCKAAVLSNDARALPPTAGFFFGSTEVDEFYWADIEYTIKLLESVLNDEKLKEYDFEYYSSW